MGENITGKLVVQKQVSSGSSIGSRTLFPIVEIDADLGQFLIQRTSLTSLTGPALSLIDVVRIDAGKGSLTISKVGKPAITLSGETATLALGSVESKAAGALQVTNSAGRNTLRIDGDAGQLRLSKSTGGDSIILNGETANLALGSGEAKVAGDLHVFNSAGQKTIWLDGQEGDIRLGGADCAENFTAVNAGAAEPGTVVVSEGEERIAPCSSAYDKRAVGVIAGAGDYRPGIRLAAITPRASHAPVALMGRVYCKVDASFGPVDVGDPLTTSPTPGYAMKATDLLRAAGATLGKALGALSEGQGLVPMLVSPR